jgi:serine/threonine protein kinase
MEHLSQINDIQKTINFIKKLKDKRLDGGAFGDVYLSKKFIIKESKNSSDFIINKNQIQIYKNLKEKNIPQEYYPVIYASNSNEQTEETNIVMEYLNIDDGWGSLTYFYKYKNFNLSDELFESWYNSLHDIIETISSNNIVHNDIKCQNVMVNYNTGEAKLLDFGLSFKIDDSASITIKEIENMISKIQEEGTAFYMFPFEISKNLNTIDPNTIDFSVIKDELKRLAVLKDYFAINMCKFFRHEKKYSKNWILKKIPAYIYELLKQNQLLNNMSLKDCLKCFYKYLLEFPYDENDTSPFNVLYIQITNLMNQLLYSPLIAQNSVFNTDEEYFVFREQIQLFLVEFQDFNYHTLING